MDPTLGASSHIASSEEDTDAEVPADAEMAQYHTIAAAIEDFANGGLPPRRADAIKALQHDAIPVRADGDVPWQKAAAALEQMSPILTSPPIHIPRSTNSPGLLYTGAACPKCNEYSIFSYENRLFCAMYQVCGWEATV